MQPATIILLTAYLISLYDHSVVCTECLSLLFIAPSPNRYKLNKEFQVHVFYKFVIYYNWKKRSSSRYIAHSLMTPKSLKFSETTRTSFGQSYSQSDNVTVVFARTQTKLNEYGVDSFLPIHTRFLGKDYYVMTGSATSIEKSYTHIINPCNTTIQVAVSLGPYVTPDTVKINNNKVVASFIIVETNGLTIVDVNALTESPLDGLRLSSSRVFGVIAGSGYTGKVYSTKDVWNMMEMIPPVEYFAQEYIIPYNRRVTNRVKVYVMSLIESNWTYVTNTPFTSVVQPFKFTLRPKGYRESFEQRWACRLRSTAPVQVIQVMHAVQEHPRAMAIIPPLYQWVKAVLVLPLTSNTRVVHYAFILIESKHVGGLDVFNLVQRKSATAHFEKFVNSIYSQSAMLMSQKDAFLIKHKTADFMVMQYGKTIDGPSYASAAKSSYKKPPKAPPTFEPEPEYVNPASADQTTSRTEEEQIKEGEGLGLSPISTGALVAGLSILGILLLATAISVVMYLYGKKKRTRFMVAEAAPTENKETADDEAQESGVGDSAVSSFTGETSPVTTSVGESSV